MSPATYARIQTYPLGDLSPYPGNAKRGDIPAILESLCRNGQYRGLVVREVDADTRIVLAGNHTLQALAAHGPGPCGLTIKVAGEERPCALCQGEEWEPVARCEIVTCDDDTARRVNLVDNRSAELGTWDDAALAALLAPISEDLAGTGYAPVDLADLLTVLEQANQDDQDDEDDEDQEQRDGDADGTALPAGQVQMILAYSTADRDEAARLVATARELAYPNEGPPEIVLHALRTLVAVLTLRGQPGTDVPMAELLHVAGVSSE